MTQEGSGLSVKLAMTEVVNYALQQNRLPVIQELVLENPGREDLQQLTLRITSNPAMFLPLELPLDLLPAGQQVRVENVTLSPDPAFLAELTERVTGTVALTLEKEGQTLLSSCHPVTALAFDQWHGCGYFPELLCAFVTPNHPALVPVKAKAAELLGQWTGDPSLDGYQTRNPNRVRLMAAAVYGALQAQNIVYSLPPASFETVGQRVRLPDAVLEQKMGTCLDLSLLYAACLESMGLRPLLILQPGHMFAGVWLEEHTFPEAVQDDPSLLTKRLAGGVSEIAVVECTALTAGHNVDFAAAAEAARHGLDKKPLEYIIDVTRSRISGIRPLPVRVHSDEGWSIQGQEQQTGWITDAPAPLPDQIHVAEGPEASQDKLALWERRLLDLGLRNTLINLRMTKSVIPLLCPSPDILEDALSGGTEYGIFSRPAEWVLAEADQKDPEKMTDPDQNRTLLESEFRNKRLRSALSEKDLARRIVGLYRAARTALEENGANTLYLALGLLRWYETKSSKRPRYAPIILLPVEIVRKSALKGYVIRLRGEDPQMNITLLEMLKQDFGITIGGLDPLPQDDKGVDIRAVFTVIRKAVMDRRGWDVLERTTLGIFSFSQFVMWNDLRNRREDLAKNKIVHSLMEGRLQWDAQPMDMGARVPEDGVLLPIPADASQLYAIEAAARGDSFVLHGPPGTGKSQTITALIANSLAQGKTVLFVAEKMAALSVVQNRLDAIGLDPFRLELHSNKSRKRDVLDQLRAASEVKRDRADTDFENRARELSQLRQELDAYAQALHQKQTCGLSLFELISDFEAWQEAPDVIRFSEGFSRTADPQYLSRQKNMLGQIMAAAQAVGHPKDHPLAPIGITEASHSLRRSLPEKLRAWSEALDRQAAATDALTQLLQLPDLPEREQALSHIAQQLSNWTSFPRAWAGYENPAAQLDTIATMALHLQKAGQLAQSLSARWNRDFLLLDGSALGEQWRELSNQWLVARLLDQRRFQRRLAPYAKQDVDGDLLAADLSSLTAYRREKDAGDALFARCGSGLEHLYQGESTDWNHISYLATLAQNYIVQLDALPHGTNARKIWATRPDMDSALESYNAACAQAASQSAAMGELLALRPGSDDLTLEACRTLCQSISAHATQLKEWITWNQIRTDADLCGLAPLVRAYEDGLSHEQAEGAYYKGLYRSLIEEAIDQAPALRAFSGTLFNEKIQRFHRLDQELLDVTRKEIFCRLAARVPNFSKEAAQNSEVGILQRAIRSGGRGISIRRLFEQLPTLLPRLCPCMLMSPLSAAQYLDPKRKPFDLVVFDEASQMPTCKAAGALARGENAVIVGDPKQMPPTSFFTSNTPDEENPDQEDLESILEDCLALQMPQTHLLWHYRSRHESLIAFSNSQFYENKLYTFPSSNDLESKVRLVPVEGFFDRGKTRQNRAEAEAIVEELKRRCHHQAVSGQSVGVVTFNINQQNLIEDLLTEACKADEALERWAYDRAEPLFIKNLENVQGDERDVILFSIGYGPDKEGRVSMNFGPLNREGGWRRLNVAVSRARQEMVVFSTLSPEKINLSRTASVGVAALKAFLEYAAGGRLAGAPRATGAVPCGAALRISRALEKQGFETRTMVGHSGYRVDVGVVDPSNPGRYLLGIVLDGPVYGGARTTRDRELAQIGVLQGLGWQIHRIWTADWWDSRDKELDKLLRLLRQLQEAPPSAEEADGPKALPGQEAPTEEPSGTPEAISRDAPEAPPAEEPAPASLLQGAYMEAPTVRIPQRQPRPLTTEAFMQEENTALIRTALHSVLYREAPVSESRLYRRVLQDFGIPRSGPKLQARMEALLEEMALPTTTQEGLRFYWRQDQDPRTYRDYRTAGTGKDRREARDVPWQEAANAICAILEEQVGLPREDLIRETGKRLGYARTGPVVTAMIHSGMELARMAGRVQSDENDHFTLANP